MHNTLLHADELPCNPQILREASAVCNQLPVLDKVVFDKDFHSVSQSCLAAHLVIKIIFFFQLQQTNEVLLVSYLAAITKGTATASEVSHIFSQCSE